MVAKGPNAVLLDGLLGFAVFLRPNEKEIRAGFGE